MGAHDTQLALIPLETVSEENQHEIGPNEQAVTDLLDQLDQAGSLVGKWRAMGATLLQTARAVDRGMRAGKISVATAQMNKMLLEGLDQMPEPRGIGNSEYDALDHIIKRMINTQIESEKD